MPFSCIFWVTWFLLAWSMRDAVINVLTIIWGFLKFWKAEVGHGNVGFFSPRMTVHLTGLSRIGHTCFLQFFEQANCCIFHVSRGTSDTSPPIPLISLPEICLSSLLAKQKRKRQWSKVQLLLPATILSTLWCPTSIMLVELYRLHTVFWVSQRTTLQHLSRGNQCPDFFFQVVLDTASNRGNP